MDANWSGKIVLVSNYVPDGQYSMQLFSNTLARELKMSGMNAELIQPEPFFAKHNSGSRGLGKLLGYFDKLLVFPRVLKQKIAPLKKSLKSSTDLLPLIHICDHSNAIYVKYIAEFPHLVTCHDLMAIRSARGDFPQNPTRLSGRYLQYNILKGLTAARYIACDSHNTRKDLIDMDPKRKRDSSTIHAGFNYKFTRMDHHDARLILRDMNLPNDARFILHVGNDSWYKNRLGVLKIFHRVLQEQPDPKLQIVFAGKALSSEQLEYIRNHSLSSRVDNPQNLTHEELQALYSTAELLLYPSHYEGFGWPPLEAQACGCPVVASHCGSLKEVLETSALIAEPSDNAAYVAHVNNILSSEMLVHELREKGFENAKRFSTTKMIYAYIDLYRELIDHHRN